MIVDGQMWFSDVVGNFMKKRSEARLEGFAKGMAEGFVGGVAHGRADGLAKGTLKSLWAVLQVRKLRPTTIQRARIARCRDPERLMTWLRRAVVAKSVNEILRPVSSRSRAHARASSPRRRARSAKIER